MTEAEILAQTFFHTMSSLRASNTSSSTTGLTTQSRSAVLSGVKCALSSRTHNDIANQTDTVNKLDYNYVIFCGPDVDVKAGDIITVTLEDSSTETVRAGKPFRWPSHKEIPCQMVDKA